MTEIILGAIVEDRITGLRGVAFAKLSYLTGCVRWSVQPQALHEGKPVDSVWIDEQQLKVVETGHKWLGEEGSGGPHDAPPERLIPKRKEP